MGLAEDFNPDRPESETDAPVAIRRRAAARADAALLDQRHVSSRAILAAVRHREPARGADCLQPGDDCEPPNGRTADGLEPGPDHVRTRGRLAGQPGRVVDSVPRRRRNGREGVRQWRGDPPRLHRRLQPLVNLGEQQPEPDDQHRRGGWERRDLPAQHGGELGAAARSDDRRVGSRQDGFSAKDDTRGPPRATVCPHGPQPWAFD